MSVFLSYLSPQSPGVCSGLGDGESPEAPWRKLGDRTMRQVAVGGAGVWGVAKDNSLWFRGVAGRTDTTVGDNWTKLQV